MYFVIVFGCFIGSNDLEKVFVCSVATDSMPIMFGFSTFFVCWVIVSYYFIGFNNLEAVFWMSSSNLLYVTLVW